MGLETRCRNGCGRRPNDRFASFDHRRESGEFGPHPPLKALAMRSRRVARSFPRTREVHKESRRTRAKRPWPRYDGTPQRVPSSHEFSVPPRVAEGAPKDHSRPSRVIALPGTSQDCRRQPSTQPWRPGPSSTVQMSHAGRPAARSPSDHRRPTTRLRCIDRPLDIQTVMKERHIRTTRSTGVPPRATTCVYSMVRESTPPFHARSLLG